MPGAERLCDSHVLLQLLEKQKEESKIWSAICASPAVVFESQGWLQGKKATAHPAFTGQLGDQR
jgi:4-methyl-5(b-hydroxyethyl)-thiazole monophosphate biosynthesis